MPVILIPLLSGSVGLFELTVEVDMFLMIKNSSVKISGLYMMSVITKGPTIGALFCDPNV